MPTPRFISAVVRGGNVVADSDVPVPWWSFGKVALAAASLALVGQGSLSLDTPVEGKPFTLRQLLQHRAGLRCYGSLRDYHAAVAAGDTPWSAEEMLRRADADTLASVPGANFAYSNIGYWIVRGLIEQASGDGLGRALQRLVFTKLGITGVTVARTPADLDATAWGNARGYDPGWVYHGLIVGPARAAALFLHRLLAGALLPPDLLTAMRNAYPVSGPIPGRPWRTAMYGLGLMTGEGEAPGIYIGHTGGGPGSTAAVFRRSGGTTAAVFAPLDDPASVERHAMELVTAPR